MRVQGQGSLYKVVVLGKLASWHQSLNLLVLRGRSGGETLQYSLQDPHVCPPDGATVIERH